MKYHIWTIGCQMNVADSERLGSALDLLGCEAAESAEDADVLVVNSCVVRQGAEDKAVGKLQSLKPLKLANPNRIVALMGCMVGPKSDTLRRRFPYVDLFMRPQVIDDMIQLIEERQGTCIDNAVPLIPSRPAVSTFVPIIQGCDKFCTFCIIPYRRGREKSRPIPELVSEARMLSQRGVREITLLGQNVDSYGNDLPDKPDLAELLSRLNEVEGIQRIRFLTSHPNDMSHRLIEAVARLGKVCEHINLPVQAGDDAVLAAMHRGYSADHYLRLVERIRNTIPGVSLSTDVIVGFPGEGDQQFQRTLDLIREVRFDKVHIAAYSERPGTIAARKLEDDVLLAEKKRRLQAIEEVQERIATDINAALLGSVQEVMIEERKDDRWEGRTRPNKLVYFNNGHHKPGDLVNVLVEIASPWSLQGTIVER